MADPRSRKIRLATGLDYHLLEWDADSDHTVVLLHGFLDLAWSWAPTVRAGLFGRFHLVAPDLRGHGDSDRVGAGGYYYFPDYFADLHSLLQKVARGRVSLVGHSMGGSVAAYYAGTYPDAISRLALLEGIGPPETGPMSPERVAAWIAAWERTRPSRVYKSVDEAAEQLRKHDPLVTIEAARELAAHGTIAVDGGYRFKHDPLHATPGPWGFQADVAARFWRRIGCPVLLVEGAQSVFRHLGEERDRRVAAFANARTVVLDGAAHMMQRHQPEALARVLADFLAG